MEYVHPETGRKQRINWSLDRTAAKQAEFRKEAVDFMNNRDLERAKAVGLKVTDGFVGLPTQRTDAEGNIFVDPLAASIKHSGLETEDMWIPKWQEFCSKPQNEEDAEYPMVTYKPRQAALNALAAKAEVVQATAAPRLVPEEKRRPGRPRRNSVSV
jgi:hypothetical protein